MFNNYFSIYRSMWNKHTHSYAELSDTRAIDGKWAKLRAVVDIGENKLDFFLFFSSCVRMTYKFFARNIYKHISGLQISFFFFGRRRKQQEITGKNNVIHQTKYDTIPPSPLSPVPYIWVNMCGLNNVCLV